MRKVLFLLVVATLALPALAQTDYHKVEVTRWVGPGQPDTYEEYLATHPPQPLVWEEVDRRVSGTDEFGPVLIIVHASLMDTLAEELDRYLGDLVTEGWDPIMVSIAGGQPATVREMLQDYWDIDHIVGAFLVGDIPVAWFELYEDWDNDGIPDENYQVQFPCDLYYMDMNGGWYDGDLDTILDTHLFFWEPELFVGRLYASTLGDQIALIRNYFDKNHAFRAGEMYLPSVGLAYIDDDWSGNGPTWGGALATATGLVEIVAENDSTTADDYVDRLDDGYYAYLLCAHSSPELHQFTEHGGTSWNNVWNWQIQAADPSAYFYNLFNCSGARYTSDGYIGGWYMFSDTYGLSALGSTKTGSMLYFEDFYDVIDEDECVGEAFRQWFALHGQEPGSVMWAMSWFYGMTHLGDPTLFMKVGLEIAAVEIVDDGTAGSAGDGDGIPDAGETVTLNITLQNNDAVEHENVGVKLSAPTTYIDFIQDSVYIGTLPVGGAVVVGGFRVYIEDFTPDNTAITFTAEARDDSSGLWGDTFDLIMRAPMLVLQGYNMTEYQGNGDPYADPGEIWNVTFDVMNRGGDGSPEYEVYINHVGPGYVVSGAAVSGLEALEPGTAGTTEEGLVVTIDPGCPADHAEPFVVNMQQGGTIDFDPRFLFQVGDALNWIDLITDPDDALVHYPVTVGYWDQWYVSDYRAVSSQYSLKFGGIQGAPYWPHGDGALEIPLFRMGDNCELRFQYWIEAEAAYDGGIVEIDAGNGWELLTPEGGYPGTSQSNGSYPGGPCFNGSEDWNQVTFDLSAYAPFAKIRFRFGSDGGVQEEGWYIDDIMLTGDLISGAEAAPKPALPQQFSLDQNYPNPFNSETVISYQLAVLSNVKLFVYDIQGRLVKMLIEGQQEAGGHEIAFDAADLTSGIYVYRLEAGEFTASRKMVLIK